MYGTTATYTVDAAGNRTSRTSGGNTTGYGWDPLNRMVSVDAPGNGYDSWYQYRADGLRAAQFRQAPTMGSARRVTSYRYDGQMPVEEIYQVLTTGGTTTETTRWAVGPRGTERQELATSTVTDVSYPLYDVHGNAIASIRRDASNPGGYVPLSEGDVRAYDPWGNAVSSSGFLAGAGGKQAYCGSLGHRRDEETGVVYMRARYYDPQVGRFTSQDPAMQGANWFAYASCNPIGFIDRNGRESVVELSVANGEGMSMEAAMDQICADFYPAFNEANGPVEIMTHSEGIWGELKAAVMRLNPERANDWEYISQLRYGNGPGTGLLKALVRFNGQLVDAFIDSTAEELSKQHGVPYIP